MKRVIALIALACIVFVPFDARAWNQSEIRWMTISTEHFNVQYHPGLERYAAEVAAIAESVYGPITELYGFKPDGKIYFNISDKEDESQGSTYFYLNRIDITATPLDFAFRGSSAWLSDVVAHEFRTAGIWLSDAEVSSKVQRGSSHPHRWSLLVGLNEARIRSIPDS